MLPKRYAILERLAVGGMGEVFLARQVGVGGFQRAVVLKRLLPDAEEDDDALHRMLDEARIIGALAHENVVAIIEVGEDDESPYLALEYVHGENAGVVRSRANKRGVVVPVLVAATIVLDAARGLQHAHAAVGLDGKPLHVIHLDIAPKNLFIRDDGVTKVGDFGIARANDRLAHTATGAIAGTLSYMSPEQLQNHALDGASDQFSLGVVLWELLTAKRLYKGDGPVETATKILTDDVLTPSTIRPDVPRALDRICLRMLAHDPSRRYPSMQAVVDAIELHMPEANGQQGRRAVADLLDEMVGKELRERRQRIEEGAERTVTEGASAWPSMPQTSSSNVSAVPTGSDATLLDRRVDTAEPQPSSGTKSLLVQPYSDGTGAGLVVRPLMANADDLGVAQTNGSVAISPAGISHPGRLVGGVLASVNLIVAVVVVVTIVVGGLMVLIWGVPGYDSGGAAAGQTDRMTRAYLQTAITTNPIAFAAAVRTDAEQAGIPISTVEAVLPKATALMSKRLELLRDHWSHPLAERGPATKELVVAERALEHDAAVVLAPLGTFASTALDMWSGDSSAPVGFLPPKAMTTVQAQLLDRGLAWIKNTESDRMKNSARLVVIAGLDETKTMALLRPMMVEQVSRIEKFAAADEATAPSLWTAVADVERDALHQLEGLCATGCMAAALPVIIGAAFADIDDNDEWQPQYEPLPSERGKE